MTDEEIRRSKAYAQGWNDFKKNSYSAVNPYVIWTHTLEHGCWFKGWTSAAGMTSNLWGPNQPPLKGRLLETSPRFF